MVSVSNQCSKVQKDSDLTFLYTSEFWSSDDVRSDADGSVGALSPGCGTSRSPHEGHKKEPWEQTAAGLVHGFGYVSVGGGMDLSHVPPHLARPTQETILSQGGKR